jgi:hypothetical protein
MANPGALEAPVGQSDIDAMFNEPLTGGGAKPQSQNDIDSLFADPPASGAPAQAAAAPVAPVDVAQPPVDPIVVPMAAAMPTPGAVSPEERRSERRRKAAEASAIAKPPVTKPKGEPLNARSFAVMFAAASIGTLATLAIFRHDVAVLFPAAAPAFEAVGLSTEESGLRFEDVRSRVSREDGKETLEITGLIYNNSGRRMLLPMMRLSIRSEGGQELFVWTATADQADIGAKDKLRFRRRLASPPPESHSVEVRFVSQQDIVASVPR